MSLNMNNNIALTQITFLLFQAKRKNVFLFAIPHQLVYSFVYNFPFPISRAEKRAAWRQARLKSLEQDAMQAQIMIKSMADDGMTDHGKHRSQVCAIQS
jgi:hypothetical protein